MFERFTDKARTAVIAARAEAAERGDQIRPVYLLHALASGDGVAARALAGLGGDPGAGSRLGPCRAWASTLPRASAGWAAPHRGAGRQAVTTPRRWRASASTW